MLDVARGAPVALSGESSQSLGTGAGKPLARLVPA